MGARIALLLLVLCTCLAGPAAAQDDEWITVGRTDKMTWHVKTGSVTFTEVQANVPVVMVVGRITEHATRRITVYKWYISVSDCERGTGHIVVLNMGGDERYKIGFASADGSAAAGMAGYICALK